LLNHRTKSKTNKLKLLKIKMKIFKIFTVGTLSSLLALSYPAFAQENSDLAKQAQNPIANMISLPFQNNTNFNSGIDERTQNVLNIQPVWPIKLSDDWNLITRTIFPVVSQPLPNGDREDGLADTVFTAFFSPISTSTTTWGIGPAVSIPTATEEVLGRDEWGLGASLVVLTQPGDWVIGSLFSQIWSLEDSTRSAEGIGQGQNKAINLFTWQYFINYNIPGGDGLYLTSAPIVTRDGEAPSGNQWTVPIGIGVGKVTKFGKQPVNGSIQAYYNVEKPEFGSDWQLRLQLQFLFPK